MISNNLYCTKLLAVVFANILLSTVSAQTLKMNNMETRSDHLSNLNMDKDDPKQFFTTGDGVRIAYRLDGNEGRPVLVLSNSIATDLHMWDVQVPAFIEYFRVLRFDTRGNGASDAPAGDYSVERMGLDLVELLDFLQIQRVHFLGLSLGGYIGQWLGVHAPERIDRLILANTSSHIPPRNTWNEFIASLRSDGDMEKFATMFINNWFPRHMIESNDSRVQVFRNMVLATTPRGLAGSYAAVRDADMRKTIALIPNRTLVIAGKYDVVTLPAHGEKIAETIPNAKLAILPAVHMSNIEYAVDFEKLVIDFILKTGQ
jgi:3-oxoadipate enol-lactonase